MIDRSSLTPHDSDSLYESETSMKTNPAFRFFLVCCGALSSHIAAPPAQAAIITWSGATDTAWSTNTNWVGDALPVSNDTLVFSTPGSGGVILNNELTSGSFTVASLIFNHTAGAYVIGDGTATANAGNPFVLGAPAPTAAFPNSITNGSGSARFFLENPSRATLKFPRQVSKLAVSPWNIDRPPAGRRGSNPIRRSTPWPSHPQA